MDATPNVRRLDQTTLGRLAEVRGELVLSFYLDLDPTTFATPRGRASQIRSLVHSANEQVDSVENGQDRQQLNREIETVEQYLSSGGFTAPGSPAMAIFSSEKLDLFEVLELPVKVEPRVEIADAPYLTPIAADLPGTHLLMLINRKTARIFAADPHGVRELEEIYDDVHSQHDQGGWSQARFQRSVMKEVRDHLRDSAEALFEIFKKGGFSTLIIGTLDELRPEVEDALHPYLQERISAYIELDIENASVDDVSTAALKVLDEMEAREKEVLLGRLREGVTKDLATVHPSAVIDAINTKRIETLLLSEDDFSLSGVRCPSCGYLERQGKTCPLDGTAMITVEDMTEPMIHLTILAGAQVQRVPQSALPDESPVAAIYRF